MRRQETINEQLRYKFTPTEHLENCEQLAAKLDYQSELEVDNKAIKTNLKEREDKAAAEIGKLTRLVRDKFELRDIQCRWQFGHPSSDQKMLIRLDTNEEVRLERLLDHERQEMLKLEMPSHVLTGPGALKDKKVSELEASDIEYFASRDEEDLIKFGWVKPDVDAVFEEAKRRAQEKEATAGPKLVEMPSVSSTTEVANASASVHDSAAQFIHEVQQVPATEKSQLEPGECEHCDSGVDLIADGEYHANGSLCPVGSRNLKLARGESAEPEGSATLSTAREAAGGTHAAGGRRGRKSHIPPPTAEEREALEALQEPQTATEEFIGAAPED